MGKTLQSLIDRFYGSSQQYAGDFRLDDNIIAKFPEGTEVVSANRYGTSAWAATARLHLKFPDGSDQRYFLKCAPERHGRTLLEGEYNSMFELHNWAPDLVPNPHSWGRCALEDPEAYFLLIEYIDIIEQMPDPEQLCSKLSRLHRESHSPNGQFGFHITTCHGRIPQSLSWEKNWTTFFTKLFQHATKVDFEFNGSWEELDRLEQRLISQVIPRLLGALEKDGRTIKPSLTHADLWEGNIGTSSENRNVYIFDPAAFYAHFEMDIAYWRSYHNRISNRIYLRTYLRYCSPSEPKDEWDDRNRLYSVYYNVIYSANHLTPGKTGRQL
jgi:protein-ribulosamine 3-kinase